jgi:hypothetical protein
MCRLVLCLVLFGLAGCGGGQPGKEVEACVERGMEYFKEVEAYPTLSDGRSASSVAAERCGRTTTAF